MKIFYWNEILNNDYCTPYFSKGCGISIGSFDGLHKGHRLLLKTLKNTADNNSLLSGVFTFYRPLPSIKKNNDYYGDISTLNQRLTLFQELGLDFVIIADFNLEFAQKTGIQFLESLKEKCNLKLLAEGVDFRCGYKGATDVKQIKEYAKKENLLTEFVDPVYYNNENKTQRVSSSFIRQLIRDGNFKVIENLLDRKFELDFSEYKELLIQREVFNQVLPLAGTFYDENNKIKLTVSDGFLELSESVTYFRF